MTVAAWTDEAAAPRRDVVADVDDKATRWWPSHQAAASRHPDSHDEGRLRLQMAWDSAGLPELDIDRLTAHLVAE
jgi:hypothetical protein